MRINKMAFFRRIIYVLIIVFFVQPNLHAQKPTNNADKLALQYYEQKEYEKANAYFEDLYDANPDAWYAYYFKNKQSHSGNKQIGFSAQEIQQQFPELVSKDENDYLSVSYANMTAVAIQAIKEQQELIKKLTTENAEIKNRLEQLEKYILNK